MIQFKDLILDVKDIDTPKRRVKIMLSRFGNVDSDGDVIQMGAFAKSILERGPESQGNRKIKFLRYHDFEHEIGVFESLEETNDGLIAIACLGRSTKGNDAFLDYQDGVITEHSIGFQTINDKIDFTDEGIRVLKELFLWEGSAVTFGANSETGVYQVAKSMNTTDQLHWINKKMDGYITALKNGKGTDERLEAITMNLKVMQSKYNSLIIQQPLSSTDGNIQPNDNLNIYTTLF